MGRTDEAALPFLIRSARRFLCRVTVGVSAFIAFATYVPTAQRVARGDPVPSLALPAAARLLRRYLEFLRAHYATSHRVAELFDLCWLEILVSAVALLPILAVAGCRVFSMLTYLLSTARMASLSSWGALRAFCGFGRPREVAQAFDVALGPSQLHLSGRRGVC